MWQIVAPANIQADISTEFVYRYTVVYSNYTSLSESSSTTIAMPWPLRLQWDYIVCQVLVVYVYT